MNLEIRLWRNNNHLFEFPTFVRWSTLCHWILFVLEHSDTARQPCFQNDFIFNFEAWRLQGKDSACSSSAAKEHQHDARENKLSHRTPARQTIDHHSSCLCRYPTQNNFLNESIAFFENLSPQSVLRVFAITSLVYVGDWKSPVPAGFILVF